MRQNIYRTKKKGEATAFYLDFDIIAGLSQLDNQSTFANNALREALKKIEDPMVRVLYLSSELQQREKEFNALLDTIVQQKIEGNKQQREEAEKVLAKMYAEEHERLMGIVKNAESIKDTPLWSDLVAQNPSVEDTQVLVSFAVRFQELGYKIGAGDLRRIIRAGLLVSNVDEIIMEKKNGGVLHEQLLRH